MTRHFHLLGAALAICALAAPAAAQLTPQMGRAVDADGRVKNDAGYIQHGGMSLATSQVVVGTTATLVVAQRAARQKVTLSVGAANTCAFGGPGVTLATGFPLQPTAGATITLDTAAPVYSVCSATTTVSAIELY